jgi:hypothetical protein
MEVDRRKFCATGNSSSAVATSCNFIAFFNRLSKSAAHPPAIKGLTHRVINVKEPTLKASNGLTSEGHRFEAMANQATAGMRPK